MLVTSEMMGRRAESRVQGAEMNGNAALATPFLVRQELCGFHFEVPHFPTLVPESVIVNPFTRSGLFAV